MTAPPHAPSGDLTVVLLHGMFGSPKNWRVCANALEQDGRVLVPDIPFFDLPNQVDPIAHLVQSVLAQLDSREMPRVVLVGNSLGGHIAARMAIQEPNRTAGLVLAGSSGLFERGIERNIQRRPERSWLRGKIAEVFFDPRHVTEELIEEVDAVVRTKATRLLRLARAAKRDSLRPFLPQVRCPALLLWGEDDRITPMTTAREFQRLLSNAQLRVIRECGHAPMIERPEQFTRLVREFVATLRANNTGLSLAHSAA